MLKAGAPLEVAYALAAVSLARWMLILTGRVAYLLGANFFLGSAAAVATMSALGRVNPGQRIMQRTVAKRCWVPRADLGPPPPHTYLSAPTGMLMASFGTVF